MGAEWILIISLASVSQDGAKGTIVRNIDVGSEEQCRFVATVLNTEFREDAARSRAICMPKQLLENLKGD